MPLSDLLNDHKLCLSHGFFPTGVSPHLEDVVCDDAVVRVACNGASRATGQVPNLVLMMKIIIMIVIIYNRGSSPLQH